ncbi:meiosis-specific APC/C activator protein-like protein AMA1 [Plenodomus tracheiphilus IPT5]|uniref:Meiosis-specific APC/C activator protein-like protein AMA1 n=1 Tax=Plenodomus tracheiphilus IPT5 TaxID=1408161 RepID=A0A6A7AWW9_9PLEO|nr:meiosis-specific APC/C activator protein-like protein AMA1 [Plenodomus tracheiphilus IPT5]
MYESDGAVALSHESGYITPPLSPTKTISTEGWLSPRTPGSPRKTRSCVFIRETDSVDDHSFVTPPSSPVKLKYSSSLQALSIPELLAPCESSPSHSDDDSFGKPSLPLQRSSSPYCLFNTLTRSHDCSSTNVAPSPSSKINQHNPLLVDSGTRSRQRHSRSVSESLLTVTSRPSSPTSTPSGIFATDQEPYGLSPTSNGPSPGLSLSSQIYRSPLRCVSSPLRPSQWVARGGLQLSPSRNDNRTPDRFIACRRPPAVTRDSFKLNRPVQRLELEKALQHGACRHPDVFGRRLRRSGRMNEELRGLREAHSVTVGRASANERNGNFRRGSTPLGARQISAGAVWNVGGPSAVSDTVVAVSTGRGSMLGRGTNAPLYRSAFLNSADPEAELETYEQRLALALDIDQTERVLQHSPAHTSSVTRSGDISPHVRHVWRDGVWVKDGVNSPTRRTQQPSRTPVPVLPFRVLDAPQLRDDYYCTLLAYCHTSKCLAVGLGNFVHLWSERSGVETPESLNVISDDGASEIQHVTCLDFSSTQGGQAILAVGRADGRISLWSSFDSEPRFDASQPKPVSCLSWRPTTVQRPSLRDRAMEVQTEELLIGDEIGHIYIYSVEWPSGTQSALFGWHGAMTLLSRLAIHTQQICGLTWSADGELFASGGNDNNCYLFETKKVLQPSNNDRDRLYTAVNVREGPSGESIYTVNSRPSPILRHPQASARHKWTLNAAVKAIAFCPWQHSLIAISGGSNDRCIHFYHTRSGACLATIDCAAQVTSLIWSQTRREIAATFGFTQPEHPYRVAVFAWPSCEQVVAVPWWDENRALCAVAYPGGPTRGPQGDDEADGGRARGEDGVWSRRGVEEGCIVVAASDMAVRFHEIWSDKKGSVCSGLLGSGTGGLLGGMDVLENSNGVEKEETVIR